MADTSIEWAEKSWNPITGCSKISEGCAHCYAERMAKRLAGRYGYPKDKPFKVTSHPDKLDEPTHWREPKTVFVCSMGDLFHEEVPFMWIALVFDQMHTAKHHRYLVLTKRPQRMKEFFEWFRGPEWRGPWPQEYPNVWLGVTAENQQRADERIPLLLQIPAAVHFVSYEPALGPISFRWAKWDNWRDGEGRQRSTVNEYDGLRALDLIIAGGETGPGARPAHPDWFRSVRDQCAQASVAFFFKSWGDWEPSEARDNTYYKVSDGSVAGYSQYARHHWWGGKHGDGQLLSVCVGKKAAGRLLDGREHNELPGVLPHA